MSWIIRGVGRVTSDRHLTGWVRFCSHGALPKIRYATCVDKQGKRYNIELDNTRGFEDDFCKANSWTLGETCEPVSEMERGEMKVKNKLTRETSEITYHEFRKKFTKELQTAFESFCKTELNKPFYNYKDDNFMEF